MTTVTFLETIWQDALYALRTMRQKPVFAATAILTMALAIGGNTAMFTVIRAVLLKPLEYRDPDRLANISGGATPTLFADIKAGAHSFSDLGAFTGEENITLSGGAEPEVLKGERISAATLRILGVEPRLGRGFRPEEDAPGGAPVVMISSELWQRRFSADPQIAGKTANLASTAYTIIGVLPPHFQFPVPGVDVWMTAPTEWPLLSAKSRVDSPFLSVFGRLKPGFTLDQASTEMKVIRHRYAVANPELLAPEPKTAKDVVAMKDELVTDVRGMLWMLFGAVGFVLLIACANVASLLLARATGRAREFALRSALGAARPRLIGQLLAESVLLSLLGGALGVLLAAWILRAIPLITSFDLPRAGEIHLDWMILGFAAVLSVATGVLFGLAPSLGASRPDLMQVLRASGEAASQGVKRGILSGLKVRGLLLVGQVALSIVLLIGAALLIKSVSNLRGIDVGFNPSHLLTMQVPLPPLRYDTNQKRASFYADLVGRVGALPGVRGAAAAMFLPMMGYAGTPVQDAAKPLLPLNQRMIATMWSTTPGYFRTLGIPLRRGRDFTAHDTADAQRVAIIDEAFARRFWPAYPNGVDPVGQRILIGGVNKNPAEIVGIAAHVHEALENGAWPESVYISLAQNAPPFAVLAIRTPGDPLQFAKSVRDQVHALDPDQPVALVRSMDDLVEEQVGQRRLLVMLLGSFAAAALLLALIGIYGIISYTVAQRTQEMGIRRALGAQQSDILRLVVGQGLRLALAGVAVGVAGAFGLTRLMSALLFHVSATDPATFVIVAAVFLLVALAASYIPARRATRIDPMAALRV
ncbi:MAG TPA: ABC transporter permease [Bryobacteraceae bacterium]|nr:ABC transporter permease [Bryobacteraceae bacterium]